MISKYSFETVSPFIKYEAKIALWSMNIQMLINSLFVWNDFSGMEIN
jgi:hypothetical protein